MAATLVNVQEKWSGVNSSKEQVNVVGAEQGAGTRVFTVLYDSAEVGLHITALGAAGIPSIGDAFPDYSWLACRRKRAVPIGPCLFEMVCEYAGKDSPLLAAAEKNWEDASSTEPTDTDGDGDLLVNAVGDPVVGLSRDIADPVYVFRQNESSYPAATMRSYWNHVNSDSFLGWDANCARLMPITATRQDDGTNYFWVVTYRFQFRADGWNHRYVNEGKRYRPAAGEDPVLVKDKTGSETVLLAANGTLLAEGGTPIWLTKPIYPSIAFAALGIS